VNNEVIPLKLGGTYNLTPDIQIEFIRMQHSIVDTAFAAIHTPEGVVLYASDFKLDRTPTIGLPPDFQRLKKLGNEGVRAMITESTNSGSHGKTPSEQIAKDLVRDVLLGQRKRIPAYWLPRSHPTFHASTQLYRLPRKWTGYLCSWVGLWSVIYR